MKALPSATFVRRKGLRAGRALAALAVCCALFFAGWTWAAGSFELGRAVSKLPPAVQPMRQGTLYSLLTTGYAITNPGTKDEMIVWPYHAVISPGSLTPSQEVELYRFLPPKRLKEMIAQGKYGFYSIGIGRDGVWHHFWTE